MAAEIFMPQLGLTMTEGKIVQWLKKVGDRVEKGEPVFEVETDKVTQEVNSLAEGTISRILIGEGASVPVGTVIAYLGTPADAETRTRGDAEIEGRGDGETGGHGDGETRRHGDGETRRRGDVVTGRQDLGLSTASSSVRSSPAARKLAEKLGVDIGTLVGSGPSGRIVEADVQRAAAAAATPAVAVSPRPPVPASPDTRPLAPDTRVELTGIRKVVAERMAHSFSTAPHFYLTVEVDAGALVALRQQVSEAVQKRRGVEVTITDLLVKAAAIALRENPYANAAWAEGAVRLNSAVNLGVAAAIGDGLVVPVIPEADRLSLAEVARRRADLVERARAGQLTLPELEGGSFTLSNLGMFGIDQFQAIVNPPQAAILAVGRIKERAVVVDGQVVARPTMLVTLSSDHRILDGATAAKFLARVVELIENPVELLLSDQLA